VDAPDIRRVVVEQPDGAELRREVRDELLVPLAFEPALETAVARVQVTADADARAAVKPRVALYVGGMGARGRNFYNDLACRYGYEGAAKEIQDLYLDGKKREAAAAVPDELVDEVALCGPKERIAELLESWRRSPVTTLIVGTGQPEALDVMAELVL
jgi:alkanesulfonate monooxygenase SsuD/methylene tetrahydromethanopterin reductase-like flavin-dependent oxidoreductase (luciferase family)